ncbi:MAG: hypothetical protein ACREDM_14045 [Methylocella sp.]
MPEPHPVKPEAFSSAISKVKWADQHIANLEKMLATMHETAPNAFFAKNHDEGEGLVNVSFDFGHFIKFMPILRGMTGDAVHNLKSAFDHVAYGIVSIFETPDQNLTFPINADLKTLLGRTNFGTIKRLVPDIADVIINDVKPYGAGNPLVGLNHLDRADKHRLLLVHTASLQTRVYMAKDDEDVPEATANDFILIANPTGVPKPGSRAAAHNERYRHAAFDIKFDAGLPFENEPVLPTLKQLSKLTAGAINILTTYLFGQNSI